MPVCISEKRGTKKENKAHVVFIENFRIKNDAQAGHCIMSCEGVFEKGLQGGKISVGDEL